jgi:hypothetical protein
MDNGKPVCIKKVIEVAIPKPLLNGDKMIMVSGAYGFKVND